MTAKRPEIELEVSSGSTFRIATEELACKITVLGPISPESAAPAPSPPLPAAPVAGPPPAVADLFLEETAAQLEAHLLAATEPVADQGTEAGSPAERLLARCARLVDLEGELDASFSSLAGTAGKIQAKVTDLRFTLAFLKNHPLLGRVAKEEGEGAVEVDRGELRKLLAKVETGLELLQVLHTGLGAIKGRLAGADGGADGVLLQVRQIAVAGQRLAEAAALFALQREEKAARPGIDAAVARQQAQARLEKSRASADKGGCGASPTGDEMSDEEALAKLAEFGL